MIGWTLCSGIGAPEIAAPWIDWRLASEIEPFPRAVLQKRFGYKQPEDHNQGDPLLWGDMTEVTPDLAHQRGIPLPDILVAGTPCQAFSIAGLRKGTEDARGNLTLKFVETCHAIVNARLDGTLTVVWENVPGVLSDKGNAFGCFLAGLVGAVDALPPPGNGSWPGEGMVQGPRARAAWAVLDAQWFGVAQRRRRVFVVVSFGDGVDPAAVLFEPDSVRGDTPPRRETGQGITLPVAPSLRARENASHRLDSDAYVANSGDWPASVAPTLNAAYGDKMGLEDQHALNGAGLFVPIAFDCKGTEVQHDASGVSPPLRSMNAAESHGNGGGHAAVAFDLRGRDDGAQVESVGQTDSLRAADGGSSRSYVAAFAENQQGAVRTADVCPALSKGGGKPGQGYPAVQVGPQVRRLTPTECARLQGFPDDQCKIEWRNKPADLCPDGPQYKSYGNSMAVPVMRWILERINNAG